MLSNTEFFTKANLDKYLYELAKRYRKLAGKKMPAELVLIGGASVLINYGFRDNTTDIDAIISAASCMKEAIYYVAEQYGLTDGWLNADFKRTTSYSSKLIQYSEYYKTFANILEVRTVRGDYLVAMKMVSGRKYKNDLSDIVGIINDEHKRGNIITKNSVTKAVENLYGDCAIVSSESWEFLDNVLSIDDIDELFRQVVDGERQTKEDVLEFRKDNPDKTKRMTANDIIDMLKKQDGEKKTKN